MLSISNIKNYLKNKDSSFKLFDIKYIKQEKNTIDNFKIDKMCHFSYYGKFDNNIILVNYYDNMDLLTFITQIGNNNISDINIIITIIYKLLDKVTKGYQNKYVWFTIRISLPHDEYNIPRWHTDGFENLSKFITILKGSGTLLIDDKDTKSINTFFDIQKN